MEELQHIRHFTAANPGHMTDRGTNQYLLGRDEVTVIDVALPTRSNIDGILEQVEAMGGKRIGKILLTHIHNDHTGGALELKRRTGAKIGIFQSRHGHLGGEDFTYGDGEDIPFDGGELIVVHTPGHESGHSCFYEPRQQILFTGDHILGRGTTVIPPPDGDMALYISSLKKLLGFQLRFLLPGHGPAIDDPVGKIQEYIAHRYLREEQILGCLQDSLQTIPEIAAHIYKDYPPALLPAGERSVHAHLIKLLSEGRIAQEANRYRINRET